MPPGSASHAGSDWHIRLKVEPRSKALYYEYLESPEWAERRKAAIRAAGGCQLCNSKKVLQVHHRTYERVGAEEPGDLTVLCRKCHHHFHGTSKNGNKAKARKVQPAAAGSKPTLDELHDIITLHLEPGQRFTTAQLADAYGYSRGRVGARLKKLAQAGEIDQLAKRQWQRPPTPNQFLREVYALADKWGANVKESNHGRS